jgi:hypothetical protein
VGKGKSVGLPESVGEQTSLQQIQEGQQIILRSARPPMVFHCLPLDAPAHERRDSLGLMR